ncbi:MAG TPA: TniQ family protein, partial [Mycobacterium sp.]|nr:TniQ family protein [Mycobacterium sp.]
MTADRPRVVPLPRIPRPARSESLDGYLRRLAAANHLPASYLYAQLARPGTGYPGRIDPERLAAATGRTAHAITRAFPTL